MTEKEWGEITVYTPSMAAKAAEMFNAFNEIWPGGFRGGIPFDEQRVRDWLDNNTAIANLVAVDPEGNLVGYCSLYPHAHDPHAAYINILGVRPLVLGKRFGKRLLLKCLEIAAEKGIYRVDLNTWAGNLRAVPLYKKVGLFWVPNTGVYMQDYLPGLFQIPLAKEWFSHHPDWYTCFKRELAQAPDRCVVEGMELYIYTFEAEKDRLTAEVDRYGWKFCGIESVVKGKRISVKTRLNSHEILMGITNALTIEIQNGTGKDLVVGLMVEPFKGLKWKELFPPSLTVKNGENVTITREFTVDSSATVFKSDETASEVIKSVVIMGDQPLELFTGGKIRPAVTIRSQDRYQLAPPGKETKVYLDLINNTKEELTGTVDVFLEGVQNSHQTVPFALSPQEVSGIAVPVFMEEDLPLITVHATPFVKIQNHSCVMPSYCHAVVHDKKDLALVVGEMGGNEGKITVLTDCIAVQVEREKGRVKVGSRVLEVEGIPFDFEVGPPFGLSQDRSLLYDYEIQREGEYLTVVLTAKSIHVPGVQIRKYVRVAPGRHEAEFWATLTNLSTQQLHVAGQLRTGFEGDLSIDVFSAMRRVFTPLKGKIVESDPTLNLMSESLVPQEPEHWEESWTAAQSLNKADFSAWMWNPEHVEKIKVRAGSLSQLESVTRIIKPGEVFEPAHVWYTFSRSSLSDVRERWNQLVGKKEISPAEQVGLATVPPVHVGLVGENVVERGKKLRKTLKVDFASLYPLPGVLRLDLPEGWEGCFISGEKPTEKMNMPEPVPGSPSLLEIELSVPVGARASELVRVHFSGEFELDFDVPFIVRGGKEVEIEEDKTLVRVSNGVLSFMVVKEVGGNLIRLEDECKRSFFSDNYPEIKPKSFITYNIGGIQPLIITREDSLFSELEKTHTEIVEEGSWRGVKAAWTVEKREAFRGQKYALTYLTLPDSHVIRIKLEHENPTTRRVRWAALLVADVELQGSLENTTITVPGGTNPWVRNRVAKLFVSLANLHEAWVRFSKGDQSLTILAPEGSPGATVAIDVTEVILGVMMTQGVTEPGGKTAAEFALVLNQPEKKVGELRKALALKK